MGVYSSFEEAIKAAPYAAQTDFNCPEYANEYKERRNKVFEFDYPVLFWLQSISPKKLFDYGGHTGAQFYAYSQYLQCPIQWMIYDLPVVMEEGKKLQNERDAKGLGFTDDFSLASYCDVFLASGSLQYMEVSLAEKLSSLPSLPKHLIINKVPLYDGPQFVTLQNGGVVYSPQFVFNRNEFISSLERLGYRLIDEWQVRTHHGNIPHFPEHSFPFHSGLYLSRYL